jgi:Trk-type K+ transport system membrane component
MIVFKLIAFAVIFWLCNQLWTLISVFAGIIPTPKNDEEKAYILATSTPYNVQRVIFASVMSVTTVLIILAAIYTAVAWAAGWPIY